MKRITRPLIFVIVAGLSGLSIFIYLYTDKKNSKDNSEYFESYDKNGEARLTSNTQNKRKALRDETLRLSNKLLTAPCDDNIRQTFLTTVNRYIDVRFNAQKYDKTDDPRRWVATWQDDRISETLAVIYERRYFRGFDPEKIIRPGGHRFARVNKRYWDDLEAREQRFQREQIYRLSPDDYCDPS